MSAWSTIQDVAYNISRAGFGEGATITRNLKVMDKLLPDQAVKADLRNVAKELIDYTKKDGLKNTSGELKQYQDALAKGLEEAKKLSGNARLTKELNAYGEFADEIYKRNANLLNDSATDEVTKSILNKYKEKKEAFEALNVGLKKDIGSNFMFSAEQAEQYFGREAGKGAGIINSMVGVMSNNELRTEALATYAGASVGMRILSGGSLTTNNRGERDIVGIPFI